MDASPSQRDLLATERWAWLREVIDTWYARPLAADDGCSDAQLADAEARVGVPLPGSLTEWYRLVGNRLEEVQDHPTTPGELSPGAPIDVWWENQGAWSVGVDTDGVCRSSDADLPLGPMPLPAAMRGLVMSDTLAGAGSAAGRGPLGELAGRVQGGIVEDITPEQLAAIQAAYPELPVTRSPFFVQVPLYGDATTFLRGSEVSGFGLEWMSASDGSLHRIDELLLLDPPGGEHVMEVSFQHLTAEQLAGLLASTGAPDTAWMSRVVGEHGHVGMATTSHRDGGGVAYRITTRDVASVLVALEASVPATLVDAMVIATRPTRISTFEIVRPVGGAGYRTRF